MTSSLVKLHSFEDMTLYCNDAESDSPVTSALFQYNNILK